MKDNAYNSNRYWATEPAAQLAHHVLAKYREWRRYYRETGHAEKALNGLRYYHGWNRLGESDAAMKLGGARRTYLRVVVNEIKPMVQRVLAMLDTRTPQMEPVAASSSPGARAETIAARDILQHTHRAHKITPLHARARKLAFLMAEAYRLILWDPRKGKPLAAETAEDGSLRPAMHEGDFSNTLCTPFDVARDCTARTFESVPWAVIRTFDNKHRLAAQAEASAADPRKGAELAAQIRALSPMHTGHGEEALEDLLGVRALNANTYTGDTIPVYHFYHVDDESMPGGRAFRCLTESIWLEEPTANPYDGLPVKRLAPDEIETTTLGDSNVFDALGLADAMNILWSTFNTNTARWGIGVLGMNKASNVSADALGNGAPSFEYTSVPGAPNAGMPSPLQPPTTPAEAYNLVKMLGEALLRGFGVNETAMGNLPFAGMPAALVAQLISQVHEYQNAFYQGIVSFETDCATHELAILKRFAQSPRMYEVMGDSERWMAREFSAATLSGISRVAFEPVPAASNTLPGKQMKLEAITAMSRAGGPMDPAAIVDFFETGRMPSALTQLENLTLQIDTMKEQLRGAKYLTNAAGQPVPMVDENGMPVLSPATGQPAMQLDPAHMPRLVTGMRVWLFIEPFLSLLSEEHESPAVVEAVLAAVTEAYRIWQGTPMPLQALLGAPQMPPPPSSTPQNGGQSQPPPQEPPGESPNA